MFLPQQSPNVTVCAASFKPVRQVFNVSATNTQLISTDLHHKSLKPWQPAYPTSLKPLFYFSMFVGKRRQLDSVRGKPLETVSSVVENAKLHFKTFSSNVRWAQRLRCNMYTNILISIQAACAWGVILYLYLFSNFFPPLPPHRLYSLSSDSFTNK